MDISNSNFKGKFVRQFRRLANKTKLEANKEIGIHTIELSLAHAFPVRSDVVVNFSDFLLSRPSLLIFPSYISFLLPFFYVTNG